MKELMRYIVALGNLYGMVHKDKVVEIYNEQNEDQIGLGDVEEYLANQNSPVGDSFIYAHGNYFVHETILEFDEMDLMLRKKGDKPHYVPEKNELLKYIDDFYYEKNKPYLALLKYVKKYFLSRDTEKAEELCEDIHGLFQVGADIQTILESFERVGIQFKDQRQINEVMQLVMDLSNNIRLWENNGHTPQEIFEKFEKPHMRPLPEKPFDMGNVMNRKVEKKVGRNEPCPCGSGKKYKKCCMD